MNIPALAPFAALAAVFLLGQQPSSLPEVVHQLPRTVPPAAWPAGSKPVDAALAASKGANKAPQAAAPAEQDKWVTVFPHVRVNRAQKAVEFDGKVPWDFHNPDTPRTELELLVCLPMRDKEHESLVMSEAKGQHVHAALLMVGLEPGTPGQIDFGHGKDGKITRRAPVGPFVTVRFVYIKDSREHADDPRSWVIDEAEDKELARRREPAERHEENGRLVRRDGNPLPPIQPDRYTYVFGGSKVGAMRNEQGDKVDVYFADVTGALIGLCTFGSETIGITRVYSPDSGVDAPNFTANNAAIPPMDTPVRVRISAAKPGVVPQAEEEEKSFPGLDDSLRGR